MSKFSFATADLLTEVSPIRRRRRQSAAKYSRRAQYHHSRDERNRHGRGYGCGRFHDGVPRSTLAFSTTTLGGTTKLFVNGAVPAADATFILPRVVTATDFVGYNGVTGFTPYTGYATDFTTPGTNVSSDRAATAVNSSVNINALKRGTSYYAITSQAMDPWGQSRHDPEHWRHRHLYWRND